jgi:cytochrome b subunit of formate dehydrogenase
MSGANHLRLKIKEQPILHLEEVLFQFLTVGTILFLLGGVTLDLKTMVFSRGAAPKAGRPVALLIGLSFLGVVAALGLAYFRVGRAAEWSFVAAVILMALAFLLYLLRPRRTEPSTPAQPVYPRFTVAQRVQHALLAISFTLLAVTGMPLRFATVDWLKAIYLIFGGLSGARIVHRVSAVVMIITWVWHTIYLLFRWKRAGFTFKSWTMAPNLKDVADFITVSKYYFGLTKEEPKYDRFQFREKFDYFAVYWGMPIMVFSGLVLWFPIYFGNRLPEIGLSVAYIAHSDEAVLAFLAIVLWHFYNTHFNPDNFPMSRTFYTGTKTREEMEREHALELDRIDPLLERVETPQPS